MTLTDAELAVMCDKSSRDSALVKLYRENTYLDAYAKHTGLRVARDPHQAIGGLWEDYGALQRDFLIAEGLQPDHRFLDLGCGTGRLARKLAPYLGAGHYTGVDISEDAIAHAVYLSEVEGWAAQQPQFVISLTAGVDGPFDMIWAFSVFNHLPPEHVYFLIERVGQLLTTGRFLFSYVPTPHAVRTGLKQFKHPWTFFQDCSVKAGLLLTEVTTWPGLQRVACVRRL